ncbi:hypothetical protein GG344DRAFT_81237 [Lentinula edodes]|nr:hypothetical protein GG344DRAFT_81237 [Lentinula edodes]
MIYNCIAFVAIALIPSRPLFELRAYLKTFAVVVNAISATTNVAIAVVFSLYFQKFKNGFPSIMLFNSDSIEVNYVMARYLQMLLAINTGCITTLCSISSLVSILAAPDTLIYVAFFFSIGRLHAITLLTTLNARKMIRQSDNDAATKPGRTSPLVFQPQATGRSFIRDGRGCRSVSLTRSKHQLNMDLDELAHAMGDEGEAYELEDLPAGMYHSTYIDSTSAVEISTVPSQAQLHGAS